MNTIKTKLISVNKWFVKWIACIFALIFALCMSICIANANGNAQADVGVDEGKVTVKYDNYVGPWPSEESLNGWTINESSKTITKNFSVYWDLSDAKENFLYCFGDNVYRFFGTQSNMVYYGLENPRGTYDSISTYEEDNIFSISYNSSSYSQYIVDYSSDITTGIAYYYGKYNTNFWSFDVKNKRITANLSCDLDDNPEMAYQILESDLTVNKFVTKGDANYFLGSSFEASVVHHLKMSAKC